MSTPLDGTEQTLYTSPYQYAAGAKVLINGSLYAPGGGPVTGRVRIDSPTGLVVGSFTADLTVCSAEFAFSVTAGGSPVTAHQLFLTVQAASTATGAPASGSLIITPVG